MCVNPRELNLYCLFACLFFPRAKGAPNGNEKSKKLLFFSLASFSLLYWILAHTQHKKQAGKHCARFQTTFNSIAVDFLNLLAVQARVWFRAVFLFFSLLIFARFPLNGNLFTVWYFLLLLLLIISLSKLEVVLCVEKRVKRTLFNVCSGRAYCKWCDRKKGFVRNSNEWR